MKESIGNAMLYNIVITFVIVFIALFVTSITYSKGYKVKNRMVEVIEKTYPACVDRGYDFGQCNELISKNIDSELNKIGYRGAPLNWSGSSCQEKLKSNLHDTSGNAFIYKKSDYYQVCFAAVNPSGTAKTTSNGKVYYVVNAYMYLDLPLIGENIMIPVRGETKTFLPGITS